MVHELHSDGCAKKKLAQNQHDLEAFADALGVAYLPANGLTSVRAGGRLSCRALARQVRDGALTPLGPRFSAVP